ncbi:MAG: (2Fe-2S)-binding protein [Armatimonadota bacterium]|nr:(2Fe-2S)-binding protein [Armatimonadota bacterium]MDR7510463.1 (2Fe-2S)-binding protein [Armatimonadota bacterium]
MRRHRISLTVNGRPASGEVEARRLLADFLREDLGLRGTHLGCEHGVCGACTVLVDGEPVRSCLMLAVQADGATVLTVEGLAAGEQLHPLQQAFWDHHALQCGFCTPGILLTAIHLLAERPGLCDEGEIREALAGNLCRCTGYQNIVDAIRVAAAEMAGIPGSSGGAGSAVAAGLPSAIGPVEGTASSRGG